MKPWFALWFCLIVPPLQAETNQTLELTANFIYRFSQFTQWPPPPKPELLLCIDRHPLLLQQFDRLELPENFNVTAFNEQDISRCNVLVLTEYSEADPAYWRPLLEQQPILVITDQAMVYRHTGVIRLFITTEGFNFDVNLARARAQGLQLSAHLLKLARSVD